MSSASKTEALFISPQRYLMNVTPAPYLPIGTHTVNSSLSSAASITVAANSNGILAQAISQNIRFTMDGVTTPTATVGFQIKAGDPPVLIPVQPGQVLKFIEETASATLQYQN